MYPGEGNGNPLHGKTHGQKSLVAYSLWGRKESGTTQHLLLLLYMCPFSPKHSFHPGCHITLKRVPCACPCFFSSVAMVLCDPMDCNKPGSLGARLPRPHNYLLESAPLSHWSYLTISFSAHPLLLLPSIFPSIKEVFSNESAHRIRWTNYWKLSFSISPSNEYLGLITYDQPR